MNVRHVCALLAFFVPPSVAGAGEILVLGIRDLQPVLVALAPHLERKLAHRIAIQHDAAEGLLRRIDAGERFDVAILTLPALEHAARSGAIAADSRMAIARTGMGLAARVGAARPELDSIAALRRTLLEARSLAYAPDVPTVLQLMRLLERLEIAGEMQSRLSARLDAQQALDAVAKGQAELAVARAAAIAQHPGIVLAGTLPEELQEYVFYAAGVAMASTIPSTAQALTRLLLQQRAHAVLRAHGFEPAPAR